MNLTVILPEISLFIGALVILMNDVFFAKKFKEFFYASHLLALICCAVSLCIIFKSFSEPQIAFNNMYASNFLTALVKAVICTLLTIVILFSLDFIYQIKKISAEFLALLMIASVGAMLLISANDFLVFYLSLELQGLSLYLLAALNRKSQKSSEAGMKYFILGSLASGILLFGIAMIYSFSGTINFTTLSELYKGGEATIPVAVMFGFLLVLTAMFFKISAAPFHMWTPDVYEGSATIVTTFFATIAKFSAVLVLTKLLLTVLIGWKGLGNVLIVVSIASLAVGSFGAIWQKNLKRLLAYSSIGHVGFVLLALSGVSKESYKASILYMLIYAVLSLGTFGFLNLMKSTNEKKDGEDDENEKTFAISSLSGLSKTNPVMAFSLAALMFSTAGIPPFAGFFSKFYAISAAIRGGFAIPALIAILFSVISAYYYLRIIKVMYFDEVKKDHAIQIDEFFNLKLIIFTTAILNLIFVLFLNQTLNLIANCIDF
ncbi:MAG: NADH-quinone oxidoreductase subunit N [Rickettsiales bacterium]|nr:NADH-quinone oxidoreductase subunit N [Rickettsiales bacterium]